MSLEEVEKLLETVCVSNSRYDVRQFEKYYCCEMPLNWLVLYDDSVPVAMCVLQYDNPIEGYVYVAEIQAFQTGHSYGRRLLHFVLSNNNSVWLCKDLFAEDSLLRYYRSFGSFDEFKMLDKLTKRWRHVFFRNCRADVLKRHYRV